MLDNTQSIICAFCLAADTPRSPYRHVELCGVAIDSPSNSFFEKILEGVFLCAQNREHYVQIPFSGVCSVLHPLESHTLRRRLAEKLYSYISTPPPVPETFHSMTSLSTTLFPGALSLRQIFANFGIWYAIVGSSPTSLPARKTEHRTA